MRPVQALTLGLLALSVMSGGSSARNMDIALVMPDSVLAPDSTFSIHLRIANPGKDRENAQVFTALYPGNGEYWFYPRWETWPPKIGWETMDIAAASVLDLEIIPEFPWPAGFGTFCCITVFAAIKHEGEQVSNLAVSRFGWVQATGETLEIPRDLSVPRKHGAGAVLALAVTGMLTGLAMFVFRVMACSGSRSPGIGTGT